MSKKLLAVVEDDESFRAALIERLDSLGYAARGFASAEAFIAWEAGASCDCIITDIHMPGMSGLDLGRLLAARHSRVPIIMVTARSDLALETRAKASGATELLRKPFKVDALIDCLASALKD